MFNLSSNNKTKNFYSIKKKPQRHNHFLKISMFTSRDWGRGLHNYETTAPLALRNTVTGQNAPLPKRPHFLPKRPHLLPKRPFFTKTPPLFFVEKNRHM